METKNFWKNKMENIYLKKLHIYLEFLLHLKKQIYYIYNKYISRNSDLPCKEIDSRWVSCPFHL